MADNDNQALNPEDSMGILEDNVLLQRHALYINHLLNNPDKHNEFVEGVIKSSLGEASVEDLQGDSPEAKNRREEAIMLFQSQLKPSELLKRFDEDESLRQEIDNLISNVNIDPFLEEAGFTDDEIEQVKSDPDAYFALQERKYFIDTIEQQDTPESERNSSFVEGLKAAKDGILSTLGNPNVKLAISAVGLAATVASGAGALALTVAGARAVTNLVTHDKISEKLIDFSSKLLKAGEASNLLPDGTADKAVEKASKLKSFFNKRNGIIGLAVTGLAVTGAIMTGDLDGVLEAVDLHVNSDISLEMEGGADSSTTTIDPNSSELSNNLQTSVIEVNSGDSAWSLAEQHFEAVTGEQPTPQQVVAMVNDLGIENPSLIKAGQTLEFSNDLGKYDLDAIGKVDADWLGQSPQSPAEMAGQSSPAALGVATPEKIDITRSFDITQIAQDKFGDTSLSEIAAQNPGLNLSSLAPGDEITVGEVTYEVPNVEDMIANNLFPNGAHPLIDVDAVVEQVLEVNNLEPSSYLFFTNEDIGRQIVQQGTIDIPVIDTAALQPTMTEIHVEGVVQGNSQFAIQNDILEAAYPNGVPEHLDRSAFFSALKDANPGFNTLVGSGDYYEKTLVIPDMTQPMDDYGLQEQTQVASQKHGDVGLSM